MLRNALHLNLIKMYYKFCYAHCIGILTGCECERYYTLAKREPRW